MPDQTIPPPPLPVQKELSNFIAHESSSSFSSLALRIFTHQFLNNTPYQNFSKHLNCTPQNIKNWQSIPAVPTSAFKLPSHPLTCGQHSTKIFHTSGTTTETHGSHHLPDTSLYELAIDHSWPLPQHTRFFLAPSASQAPHSSLSHMLSHLNHGDQSHFLLHDSQFHLAPLFQHLSSGQPLSLIGTALAFHHLMEVHGPIPLPPGSQLLETGGYKGSSLTLSKPEFYQKLSQYFSIPLAQIHNEYGMTELSSQAYASGPEGRHRFPHWCRHLIIDPDSGQPLPSGQMGYLIIHDLANLHSVAKIRTQDFAIGHPDHTFTLIGRDPAALPRGCSRSIDHTLS